MGKRAWERDNLEWHTIDGGGGTASGGAYTLSGGFWGGAASQSTIYTPLVLRNSAAGS